MFQNNIPVFSPALTDGSLGDMIYFHSYKKPGLVLDIVEGKSSDPKNIDTTFIKYQIETLASMRHIRQWFKF